MFRQTVQTAGVPDEGAAPAGAPRTRRLCAWAFDFAVIVAVAVLLGWGTFHRISAEVTDVTSLAGTSAWEVITSDGDLAGAGQSAGETLWRHAVRDVQQAFAALVVFTFAYHFLSLAVMSRTPGQALTALCVVRRRGGGRPGGSRAAARAAATTLVDVGWYALACCLLVGNAIGLSVLCWVVAVAFFALNAWLALVGSRRSLADRLGGVTVTSTWRVRAALARIGGAVRRRGQPEY
ncbi:RDD family protein [Streptomyces sp. ME19-01-6]|uniref:RDD family protein n=1 Tax=Streptomyces sp. ME19-01-6 TaxID=3028686 RepID=UPI0029ACCF16|nr:RDD family protein [Streptomyces sp. ME19-01-6]MDX3227119.1 RDD family protein [Streptomyces sp. ME19-01-6]